MSNIIVPRRRISLFDPHLIVTWEEHLQELDRQYEKLVQLALLHWEKGLSYRDFRVGAAALAFRPYTGEKNISEYLRTRYRIFTGHNVKPGKRSLKMCAEQMAVNGAQDEEYRSIIAMVVVGEPQEDDLSHLRHPTLHCCSNCRETLTANGQMKDETRIITYSFNEAVEPEERTWKEMCDLHAAAAKELKRQHRELRDGRAEATYLDSQQ